MRIAVAGILHESNTFLPFSADRQRWLEGGWHRGAAIPAIWSEAHHELGGFLTALAAAQVEAVPIVTAVATPSGPVVDAVFEELCDQLLTGIAEANVAGVLLALHGAMVAESYPDADTEVVRRLRARFGRALPLVLTLDYHGNCTRELADLADAIVAYQTYPHIDQRTCGAKAADLLLRRCRDEIRPVTAIAQPRLVPNLLGQATDREPMRSLLAQARAWERQAGLLSVSLLAGFPYADVPEMGAAVIAVADGDRHLAKTVAQQLAAAMWQVREQLQVPAASARQAVAQAIAATAHPVVLVDIGDNIGGGAAGDGTVLLQELLQQQARDFVVALFAPQAVQRAAAVGVGGTLTAQVGGQVDRRHGEPVQVHGTVLGLYDGRWTEAEARHGGRRFHDQGPSAVIGLAHGGRLLLNSYRTPPFSLGQLTSVGIEPKQMRIIVVKAAVAHRAAYDPIAAHTIYVDTPGVTALDPRQFVYHHVRRPLWPLDT